MLPEQRPDVLEPRRGGAKDPADLAVVVYVGADLDKVVRGQVGRGEVVAGLDLNDGTRAGRLVVEVEGRPRAAL